MRSLLMLIGTALAAVASVSDCNAQQTAVVPGHAANSEGDRLMESVGIGRALQQQFLIGAGHLDGLVGRMITGFRFRREGNDGSVRVGSSANWTVRIGSAGRAPTAASTSFAANLPQPMTVFQGIVTAPATVPAPAPAGWDAGSTIVVAFSTAYPYWGGDLCLQIDGSPSGAAGSYWPIDAIGSQVAGTVQEVGTACGGPPNASQWALVDPTDLVVGNSIRFIARGADGQPAWMLLGLPLPAPVDLSAVGAPGCELRVLELAAFGAVFDDAALIVPTHRRAVIRTQIPSQAGLLGASFAVQWVTVAANIETSETILCQVAPSAPMHDLAVVTARADGSRPTVSMKVAPVIRFDVQ